jgi:hypothetical protein
MVTPLLPCLWLTTSCECPLVTNSHSYSYFMTGSLSCCQASWGSWPEVFFFRLNASGHGPYVISFLTRGWFVPCGYAWPFVKCMYYPYSMLLKILPFALYTSPLSVRLCKADHVFHMYLMLKWQLSHLNGSKLDHRSLYFPCLATSCPILRTCSFSWFYMTSACYLHSCVL